LEIFTLTFVAGLIVSALLSPKLLVGVRAPFSVLAIMSMPEAAVNENYRFA
jgi:hypothetical protein